MAEYTLRVRRHNPEDPERRGPYWLDASVESPVLPNDVSVDPLFTRVGVAFRF